jgi:NAD(P)-dependent dehydrogenase (short-subunit alcohol dehydrogenase family)
MLPNPSSGGKAMSKVYVITGGSGGMGKAIARYLGKLGTVLLADVNEERLKQAATELAEDGITNVEYRVVDITNESQVDELATTAANLGELGAIVHTAGLSPTMADGRKIMEVNSIGTGLILKAFLSLAQPGTVAVCIASMAGICSLATMRTTAFWRIRSNRIFWSGPQPLRKILLKRHTDFPSWAFY